MSDNRHLDAQVSLIGLHYQEESLFFTRLPFDVRRKVYSEFWLEYGNAMHIHMFGPNSHICHYPCLLDADAFDHHGAPTGPGPATTATTTTNNNGPGGPGNGANPHHLWDDSPWCSHRLCYRSFLQAWPSFGQAYHRHSTHANPRSDGTVGLALPFLVCKRVRMEGSEYFFKNTRFHFPSAGVLERFMAAVPREFGRLTKFVHLMESTPLGRVQAPYNVFGSWAASATLEASLLPGLCKTLCDLLPTVAELCLTLHIAEDAVHNNNGGHMLPSNDFFHPLWVLARGLTNTRKIDIKLVTRCTAAEGTMAYGGTPGQFASAPFKLRLVQRGYHCNDNCVDFWLS